MAKKKSKSGFLSKGLSQNRKLEILGILIIAIAVLLAISIITYHPGDYESVQAVSLDNIISTHSGPVHHIHNSLGVFGAYIAYYLVRVLFGYMSFFIPLLLAGYGWVLFREKEINKMLWPTVYGIWCMILLAAFFGWITLKANHFSSAWCGGAGYGIAVVLTNVLNIGAIILLCFLLIATAMAILGGDVQLKVDLLKDRLKDAKSKWEGRQHRREKKKKESARRKEIKKQQTAERKIKDKGRERRGERRETLAEPERRESIDDIVNRSQHEDIERLEKQRQETQNLDNRPRAILDKEDQQNEGDDVDISVFVGEGDEAADANELERQNRNKAREIPEIKYKFPTIDLLDNPPEEGNDVDLEEIKNNKRIILDKLKRHNIEILKINAIVGPTVTLYELEPAPDVKISKIKSYASDLKMATAARGLRIIAPIPGRAAVGIEVPNKSRETVFIRTVINTKKYVETDADLPIALGKTIENEVFLVDLAKMPHVLIAGATGSGKTVGINTIITSLLYKCNPDDLKFVMIDPKKIELSLYRNIQNHFIATLPGAEEPIITDTTKALETLESLTLEMDDRYDLMKMAMVRHIKAYNKKFNANELDDDLGHRHLPYIVVIIDELADLMMTAGKTIEEPIARLAQLARAVGIHLVLATQRPSVNVITGTIKANFPARMAYQVASKVDSRTILDIGGADQLIGRGDLLFTNGGGMTRIQNAFVSTSEVEEVTAFIGQQRGYKHPFYLPIKEEEGAGIPDPLDEIDEYFKSAAKIVVLHQQGSVSLLQRKLKIGYNRAGRIIDQLYQAGIVGPFQGSTARNVLVENDEELEELIENLDAE